MVKVVLRGGLGNQMFQYAAGLNLALSNDQPLVLDTTYLHDRLPRPGITLRDYDLDIFTLQPTFTNLSRWSSELPIPGFWTASDLVVTKAKSLLGFSEFITEQNAGQFFKQGIKKDVALWGFLQGEKYFAEHKDAVRAAFRFKHPLTGDAAALAEMIQKENSVSLHVRRGDYLLPKYQKLYGETNLPYYEDAVAYMAERVTDPHFFVFSDDIAWCREHIKPKFRTTYLDDASRGPKASFHLELMSRCKNNIIANSSFSWWGAWLNRNPDKVVVAPERWTQDGTAEGVVPALWVRL
jgi:glycosyl transferase family 11